MIEGLIAWTTGWAMSPYGPVALFLLAFAESSFFPVPPDVLLIPLGLLNIPLALFFALIATAGSVLGGIFGYAIGKKGGRPVLDRLFKEESITAVAELYNRYDHWAIFIGAFTPLPYKLFTLSAGAFRLNFKRFILVSIIGRGGRFFVLAALIMLFGPAVQDILNAHFNAFTVLFVLLLLGGFFAMRFIAGKIGQQQKNSS